MRIPSAKIFNAGNAARRNETMQQLSMNSASDRPDGGSVASAMDGAGATVVHRSLPELLALPAFSGKSFRFPLIPFLLLASGFWILASPPALASATTWFVNDVEVME